MKYVLVIGDGMADDPVPELNGKTPLQYAKTPVMDRLAGAGVFGNVLTVPDGIQAGSDTAILTIFGCDPQTCYFGRAPLEAAALGIQLSEGDIAYRMNLITLEDGNIPFDEKKIISHSSGAIDGRESDELIKGLYENAEFASITKEAEIKIYLGSSFRHIAVQSNVVSRTLALTPPHDYLNEPAGLYLPKGDTNAVILKKLIKLSYKILNDHPVNIKRRAEGKLPGNCIWFWADGKAAKLPDFKEKYNKKGSVISAVPLCQGIGLMLGLDRILVDGATGELHTNYEGKMEAAVDALITNDFVAVHIEAPDECTHNGDLKGKIQAIEWIDSRVISPLLEKLDKGEDDYRLLIMSDHRTLSSTRGHDAGPVPYILYDSRTDQAEENRNKAERPLSFCEKDAALDNIINDGTKLMSLLFEEAQ